MLFVFLIVVSEAPDAWQRQMLRPATSALGEDGHVGPGRALRRSYGAPLQHLLRSEVVAVQCVPRGAQDSACRGDGDVLHEQCPRCARHGGLMQHSCRVCVPERRCSAQ